MASIAAATPATATLRSVGETVRATIEVRDPNGRAYNRTAHLAERRAMMQTWADYLDKLKAGAEVIPLPQRA